MAKKNAPANHFAHILPFPVWPIFAAPAMISADGPVYRAAFILAFTYWVSGCRPLPADKSQIGALIRIPQSHIKAIKPRLDAVLAEILPILATEYERAHKTRAERAAVMHAVTMASLAARRARGKRNVDDIPQTVSVPRIHPTTAPPHRNPRADLQARQQATERQNNAENPAPPLSPFRNPSRAPHRVAPPPAQHASGHGGMLSDATPRK